MEVGFGERIARLQCWPAPSPDIVSSTVDGLARRLRRTRGAAPRHRRQRRRCRAVDHSTGAFFFDEDVASRGADAQAAFGCGAQVAAEARLRGLLQRRRARGACAGTANAPASAATSAEQHPPVLHHALEQARRLGFARARFGRLLGFGFAAARPGCAGTAAASAGGVVGGRGLAGAVWLRAGGTRCAGVTRRPAPPCSVASSALRTSSRRLASASSASSCLTRARVQPVAAAGAGRTPLRVVPRYAVEGAARALLRCHEPQTPGVGRRSAAVSPADRCARPRTAAQPRQSGRRRMIAATSARSRDTQRAAGAQHVDVALESAAGCSGRSHTIARLTSRACAGMRGACDMPQRVVRPHGVGRAGLDAAAAAVDGCGGLRQWAHHRGAALDGGFLGNGFLGTHARGAARRHAGAATAASARRSAPAQDGRVEQDRVFTQQAAARPVGLDEQRDERLRDGRGDVTRRTSRPPAPWPPGSEVGEEAGPVESVTRKGVAGGERGAQRAEVVLRRRDQLDFSVERLIQGRIQVDVAQAERLQRARGHQRAQQQDAAYGSFHRVSQPVANRKTGRSGDRARCSRDFCELDITIAHGYNPAQPKAADSRLFSPCSGPVGGPASTLPNA